MLDTVSMAGVVVIGEGEKDEAPMLFNGEEVGDGHGPAVDVAVDPLEGTRLTALGQPNAIAVIAVAERGTMFFPGAAVYMDKIAVGPEALDAIDIEAPPRGERRAGREGEGHASRATSAVVVLERDRHEALVDELREAGAKVLLITRRRRRAVDRRRAAGHGRRPPDGHRRHAGGRDLGGRAEVRRRRRSRASSGRETTRSARQLVDAGFDLDRMLTTDDLVAGEDVFVAATGVTSGALLQRRPATRRRARSPTRS